MTVRRWLHLQVLRHHPIRHQPLGNPTGTVYGAVVTCSCGAWWTETYWNENKP